MANPKRLFMNDYLFKGKYIPMVNALTTVIDPRSGAKLFNSAIELYITAAIVGAHYQVTAAPDNSSENIKIFASQFSNHYDDLRFVYQLVMLEANKDELSAVDRINNAFRYSEEDPEYAINARVFESYMLGGVEFLYNRLCNSSNNSFDDYRISVDELIADMCGKQEREPDDEFIDFGPVF